MHCHNHLFNPFGLTKNTVEFVNGILCGCGVRGGLRLARTPYTPLMAKLQALMDRQKQTTGNKGLIKDPQTIKSDENHAFVTLTCLKFQGLSIPWKQKCSAVAPDTEEF